MSDDRYVHDPDAFEGEDADTEGPSSAGTDPDGRTFDRRNWLLVAAIVVSFLLIPAVILYQPVRVNSFVFTYLVLPLVPAFLLGALAVWATAR